MNDRSFKKAFDIGDIPADIDLNAPPVTGFDYLYRVRLETRKCPKVVVSNIDKTKFLDRQNVQVNAGNGFIRARPGFEPGPEWKDELLYSFLDTKLKMNENREFLQSKFEKRNFPKISKVEEWCLFCLGSDCQNRIYPPEDLSDDKDITEVKVSPFDTSGTPPYLSIMLYLNQPRVAKLLSYHAYWLEQIGFSRAQGEWIYALLICLEKPLEPDTCALLRSLSRTCNKLRNDLTSPEDEFLKPLNLILSIISECFDQKDMSDSFTGDETEIGAASMFDAIGDFRNFGAKSK